MVRCRFAAVHHRARKPRCSPACEARHRLVQASIGWENPKEGASTSPSSPKRGTPQKSSQLRCLAAAQCNGEKKGAKGQLDWGVRLPQSGRRKSQGGLLRDYRREAKCDFPRCVRVIQGSKRKEASNKEKQDKKDGTCRWGVWVGPQVQRQVKPAW